MAAARRCQPRAATPPAAARARPPAPHKTPQPAARFEWQPVPAMPLQGLAARAPAAGWPLRARAGACLSRSSPVGAIPGIPAATLPEWQIAGRAGHAAWIFPATGNASAHPPFTTPPTLRPAAMPARAAGRGRLAQPARGSGSPDSAVRRFRASSGGKPCDNSGSKRHFSFKTRTGRPIREVGAEEAPEGGIPWRYGEWTI